MIRDALVVGINTYSDKSLKNLTAPAEDAEAVAQLLEKYGDFKVTRLPVFPNKKNHRPKVGYKTKVTLTHLEKAIVKLFKPEGQVPDTALLYFSGHGLRKNQGIPEGFLATSDVNLDLNNWGVRLKWLRELLQESEVKQQIIILDCCHSGELLNFTEADPGDRGKGRDRCFIAASREFGKAYQGIDNPHSVFTSALLKALEPLQNRWVTNYTLVDLLNQESNSFPQRPIFGNSGEPINFTRRWNEAIESPTRSQQSISLSPVNFSPELQPKSVKSTQSFQTPLLYKGGIAVLVLTLGGLLFSLLSVSKEIIISNSRYESQNPPPKSPMLEESPVSQPQHVTWGERVQTTATDSPNDGKSENGTPNLEATPSKICNPIFNIDFSTPIHKNGKLPAIGKDFRKVSKINFGNPLVSGNESSSYLKGQYLQFDTMQSIGNEKGYDKIELNVDRSSQRYLFKFDLYTNNFVDAKNNKNKFTIHFDTPTIQKLNFNGNGKIRHYQPRIPGNGSISGVIGSFQDQEVIKMAIDINLHQGKWTIFQNGRKIHTSPFYSKSGDIKSIRFNLGNLNRSPQFNFGIIGLDNIVLNKCNYN
ncbi:MAG: caspase family protein [Cyanobacteria bacterium J06635_10]